MKKKLFLIFFVLFFFQIVFANQNSSIQNGFLMSYEFRVSENILPSLDSLSSSSIYVRDGSSTVQPHRLDFFDSYNKDFYFEIYTPYNLNFLCSSPLNSLLEKDCLVSLDTLYSTYDFLFYYVCSNNSLGNRGCSSLKSFKYYPGDIGTRINSGFSLSLSENLNENYSSSLDSLSSSSIYVRDGSSTVQPHRLDFFDSYNKDFYFEIYTPYNLNFLCSSPLNSLLEKDCLVSLDTLYSTYDFLFYYVCSNNSLGNRGCSSLKSFKYYPGDIGTRINSGFSLSLNKAFNVTSSLNLTYLFPTDVDEIIIYNRNWSYINLSSNFPIDQCNLNFNGILYDMSVSDDKTICYLNKTDIVNGSYNYCVEVNTSFSNISGISIPRSIIFGGEPSIFYINPTPINGLRKFGLENFIVNITILGSPVTHCYTVIEGEIINLNLNPSGYCYGNFSTNLGDEVDVITFESFYNLSGIIYSLGQRTIYIYPENRNSSIFSGFGFFSFVITLFLVMFSLRFRKW